MPTTGRSRENAGGGFACPAWTSDPSINSARWSDCASGPTGLRVNVTSASKLPYSDCGAVTSSPWPAITASQRL